MGDVHEFRQGWSLSRLADEFRMDRRTAAKRIREAGIPSLGRRGGHEVYALADAAPALVDAATATNLCGIDPRDLPPMERRAYFQSENERLKVEVTTGALVPAGEVEGDYAELMKKISQFFDTLPDVLERDCALRPGQVLQVQASCDRVRQAMYDAIVGDESESDAGVS